MRAKLDIAETACSSSSFSQTELTLSESETEFETVQTKSSGLVLKRGRLRLPGKLMEYLNQEVAPEALHWMHEGYSFVLNIEKAQEQFLDIYLDGTKHQVFFAVLADGEFSVLISIFWPDHNPTNISHFVSHLLDRDVEDSLTLSPRYLLKWQHSFRDLLAQLHRCCNFCSRRLPSNVRSSSNSNKVLPNRSRTHSIC